MSATAHIRSALALVAAVAVARPSMATTVIFEGQQRAIPLRIEERFCPPLPPIFCELPCAWTPLEYSVPVTIKARTGDIVEKAEWKAFDSFGIQVGAGVLPTGGNESSGVMTPFNGVPILTDCGTFYPIHYRVTYATDNPNGPAGDTRGQRTFTVNLKCIDCNDRNGLRLDYNGPLRVPLRAWPQDHMTQWIVLNGTERALPATISFETSAPWVVVEPSELTVILEPGAPLDLAVPIVILPEADIGSQATIRMTVAPLFRPELAQTIERPVRILPPGDGECVPNSGTCFEPNAGPGCSDPLCCEAVCAADPFCCAQHWDDLCVQSAVLFCASKQ